MAETSIGLFERLRAAPPDDSDWAKLQGVYLPVILQRLSKVPGLGDESADLAQEILIVVARVVPTFDRERQGSFRAWLREVIVNHIKNYRRKLAKRPVAGLDQLDSFLREIADPNGSLAREWDRQHDKHVTERLLAIVRSDFSPDTWATFHRFCIEGIPAQVVAQERGSSVNKVILAKHRVLKRLRQEAGELLG